MSLRYIYPEMAAATADFCTWGWGVTPQTLRRTVRRQETAATRDFDQTYDRFGSKADVTLLNLDVRFTPENGL
jgi:hypothetical protein